ncbi:hypothetical protein V8F06_013852 [Rhypophila decipiens]
MRTNFLIIGVFFATALSMESPDIFPRQDDFATFAKDIQVPETQINSLSKNLASARTSTAILTLACLTAQVVLGGSQVDTAPLDQAVVKDNWSQTCVAQPYCIVQPRNAKDVSVVIRIIDFFKVKFAVRSGGHSPNPGFSSIGSQGILIDLQRLDAVSVSADKKVATVSPGARWGDVFSTLDANQTSIIGGRIPGVGVGGLILGGGLFHTSERFGLAADNVKSFELVKSNGDIIKASPNQNADLFWALKGGGPNFGIVTKFELYTVPTYLVWGSILVFGVDQANEVLAAFDQWQNHGSDDVKSTASMVITLDVITVFLTYSDPVPAPPPAVFAPFNAITPLAVALPPMNVTFKAVNQLASAGTPNTPARHDYRAFSSRIDTALTQEIYAFWRGKAVAARDSFGVNQTFVVQHIGEGLRQAGISKGGNALNIPPGRQQWWTTLIDWTNPEFDAQARQVSIDTTARWSQRAKERGVDLPFLYLNDASRDQNPLASYGAQNLAKLKAIAAKYDPKQVFQKLQNGGFLVSKA